MENFTFIRKAKTRTHLEGAYQEINKTRKRTLSFLGLLLALFLFVPSQMQAQHPYGFMDGNVWSNGQLDWEDVWKAQQPDPPVVSPFPEGTILSPILFDDQPDEYIFTGGNTKDHIDLPSWQNKPGTSSDKTNIQQAGAILIDGKIYFFGNRYSSDGSTNIGFWFFQDNVTSGNGTFDGVHMPGDILVVAEIAQGGAVGNIAAYEWMGPGLGDTPQSTRTLKRLTTSPTTLSAVVNLGAETTPWPMQAKSSPANSMPPITFFEGFIDLVNLELSDACFSSFLVETRASFSVNSVLEDFVGGALNVRPDVTLDDITACETDSPVTLTAYIDGGIPPYTYKWTGPAGFDATAASGEGDAYKSIQVSIPGEYSVTIECQGIVAGSLCIAEQVFATVTFVEVPDLEVVDLEDCEEGTTGAQTFDLNDAVTDGEDGDLSFYEDEDDAKDGLNAIGDPTSVSVSIDDSPKTFWVRSDSDDDSDLDCYALESFTVSVYVNPSPSISDQEECVGDTATFTTADVLGYTYAWYKSTDGGSNYSLIPGETDNSYTTGTLVIGDHNTIYKVIATDTNNDTDCTGEDTSTLSVYANPAPSVDNQTDLCAGDTAIFSTPMVAGYTYQWAVSTDSGSTYTDLPGETGNTLSMNEVTMDMSGNYYRVVATDDNFTTNCTGDDFGILTVITCITGEGCTLGYWKNHTDRWACFSTCTLYGEVFASAPNPNGPKKLNIYGLTLLEALNLGGNTNDENLARQSVAALLNTCSKEVGYEYYSVTAIVNAVNAAWDSKDRNTTKNFAIYLDDLNNSNCPLGGTSATTEPSPSCIDAASSIILQKVAEDELVIQDSILNVAEEDAENDVTSVVENGFNVSPVPFRESLSVQYDFDYVSDATIQMFDLQGRLLITQQEANASKGKITNLGINFRILPSQIYVIKVTTDRDVFTKKIVSDK